ncbi:MAG: hypothetical protein JHC33_13490 [Ignisphaera sp.]|nr:hypothetical protein [Ignisphaera sp.]
MPELFPGYLPPTAATPPSASTLGAIVSSPSFTNIQSPLPPLPSISSLPSNVPTPLPSIPSDVPTPSKDPNGWSGAGGVGNLSSNFDYSKYTSPDSLNSTTTPGVGQAVINGITRALPHGFKTDLQVLSDFRLGTFLRRHGNLTGDQASILDGAIDFIRDEKRNTVPHANFSIDYTKNFIPIIIKTQFNIDRSVSGNIKPFYIVFDSTPDTISFGKSATWTPQNFYGRPEPIQIYANSGSVSFSLTGTFFSVNPEDHNDKLNLSNRLLALTTPSKYHLMPSPVEIKIGEWKHLRCVVNEVKIDYKGPWWISSANTHQQFTSKNFLNQADSTTYFTKKTQVQLPSHAPYIYEVTFSFTVISELNGVQYAEDIMSSGWNGGMLDYKDAGYSNKDIVSNQVWGDITTRDTFRATGSYPGNVLTNNQRIVINDSKHTSSQYLTSLGLSVDSSGGYKSAAMGEITSGLTASITGIINNKYGAKISKMLGK